MWLSYKKQAEHNGLCERMLSMRCRWALGVQPTMLNAQRQTPLELRLGKLIYQW
jgi:hypothetical protein